MISLNIVLKYLINVVTNAVTQISYITGHFNKGTYSAHNKGP